MLLLAVGLVVLWIQAPALYGRGDAAKTAAATTRGAILTVAAALIAATAAGAGLYMTARTIRINQQTLVGTQWANREADQRDRYAKAIDQLGSDKIDVRLGGIYGLERIAETSERDQRTVVEVLSAFIREHSRPTTSRMLLPIERSRMLAAEPPRLGHDKHGKTVLLRPGPPPTCGPRSPCSVGCRPCLTCPAPTSPMSSCPTPSSAGRIYPMPTSAGRT